MEKGSLDVFSSKAHRTCSQVRFFENVAKWSSLDMFSSKVRWIPKHSAAPFFPTHGFKESSIEMSKESNWRLVVIYANLCPGHSDHLTHIRPHWACCLLCLQVQPLETLQSFFCWHVGTLLVSLLLRLLLLLLLFFDCPFGTISMPQASTSRLRALTSAGSMPPGTEVSRSSWGSCSWVKFWLYFRLYVLTQPNTCPYAFSTCKFLYLPKQYLHIFAHCFYLLYQLHGNLKNNRTSFGAFLLHFWCFFDILLHFANLDKINKKLRKIFWISKITTWVKLEFLPELGLNC